MDSIEFITNIPITKMSLIAIKLIVISCEYTVLIKMKANTNYAKAINISYPTVSVQKTRKGIK